MGQVFRARRTGDGAELVPVEDRPPVRLADLVGYRQQKDLLIRNTEAFLRGKGSNNVLLYGDAGTGNPPAFRPSSTNTPIRDCGSLSFTRSSMT